MQTDFAAVTGLETIHVPSQPGSPGGRCKEDDPGVIEGNLHSHVGYDVGSDDLRQLSNTDRTNAAARARAPALPPSIPTGRPWLAMLQQRLWDGRRAPRSRTGATRVSSTSSFSATSVSSGRASTYRAKSSGTAKSNNNVCCARKEATDGHEEVARAVSISRPLRREASVGKGAELDERFPRSSVSRTASTGGKSWRPWHPPAPVYRDAPRP